MSQAASLGDLLKGLTSVNDTEHILSETIKIRGKSLIINDTIYQISNITSVRVVELHKTIPWFWILVAVVGFFSLFSYFIFGAVVLAVSGAILYNWYTKWMSERYGLGITTSAGSIDSIILLHNNKQFLTRAALTINNIMNTETPMNAEINIRDHRILGDVTTINTGDVVNSVIAGESVTGSVSQNV